MFQHSEIFNICNVQHVLGELVKLPVSHSLLCVRIFEGMDFQAFSRIECKVPTLPVSEAFNSVPDGLWRDTYKIVYVNSVRSVAESHPRLKLQRRRRWIIRTTVKNGSILFVKLSRNVTRAFRPVR